MIVATLLILAACALSFVAGAALNSAGHERTLARLDEAERRLASWEQAL